MLDSHVPAERRRILNHLNASRPYLEASTPYEIAKELMVQALDIVARSERESLFRAALDELNDEGQHESNDAAR